MREHIHAEQESLKQENWRKGMSGQMQVESLYELTFKLLYQVQEPPNWILKPSDVRGVEMEKIEFKCQALGSPNPKYTWVDKEGIDATEKEGKTLIAIS